MRTFLRILPIVIFYSVAAAVIAGNLWLALAR
jgi:hypothetical protein